VKYLVLAGVSSAFLVFGMALVYARLGALDFASLQANADAPQSFVVVVGLALILVGVGFKLSLVPFHMWTPDVFQGAPAPVTGFLATVSKGAVLAVLLRYFQTGGGYRLDSVTSAMTLIAIASILAGNLLALLQRDLKRILAYSSIAHFGYLLIAFLAGGAFAVESVNFYLAAYVATTLAAFGVIAVVASDARRGRDLDEGDLEIYRGLLWRRPALAGLLALSLISLAGLPVSIGFVAKFYVLAAGVEARSWTLVAALVVGSAIGLFYYLRIVAVLAGDGAASPTQAPGWRHAPGYLALLLLGAFIVGFGAYPSLIVEISRSQAQLGTVPVERATETIHASSPGHALQAGHHPAGGRSPDSAAGERPDRPRGRRARDPRRPRPRRRRAAADAATRSRRPPGAPWSGHASQRPGKSPSARGGSSRPGDAARRATGRRTRPRRPPCRPATPPHAAPDLRTPR
jgi:NADH-quinone oxidoreductase subunit N